MGPLQGRTLDLGVSESYFSLLAVFRAFAFRNGLFQCRWARNMSISVRNVQILPNKPYFNLYSKFG